MVDKTSVSKETWNVYVLRDKYGRYFSRMTEPTTSLRSAWRFNTMEDIAVVMNSEYYAPDADLGYLPVKVQITIITVESEIE